MALDSGGGARTVAGRYRIERELGRGGMGIVWQALDLDLQRPVAIKEVLVPGHLSDDERADAHARVRREAQTAARVNHPSVITLHDVFDHDGHPWVVMELIRGRSLQEVLADEGTLPPERVAAVAGALLEAVGAAHATGVVHRDIKPGNIMVCDQDRVVLTDFGIATMEGGASITRTGALVGSPEFISPERLQNEQATPASDLWSVGVTLFTALEGRSPFHRDTITAAIAAVLSAPIPPLPPAGQLGPLGPLVAGLLERDPGQRLSAEAALELLRAPSAAGGAAAAAAPSGPQAAPSGPQPPAPPVSGPNTPHPSGTNTPPPGAPNTPPPGAAPATFHPSARPPAANTPQPGAPPPFTTHRPPPHSTPAAPPGPAPQPGQPGPPGQPPTGPGAPHPGGRPMPGPAPGGVPTGPHAPHTAPHTQHPSAGMPPPAPPQPGYAPGPAGAGGSGGRSRRSAATVPLLVSGGALVLVVAIVAAAVLLTRDWTDYTTFRSAWFNVDYPADWGVDDSAIDDEAFVRFTPDDDHLLYIDGWENGASDPTTSYGWVEADDEAFQEDPKVSDYESLEMAEVDEGFPSHWDVAHWEAEFSHTEWPTQQRYFATHLVTIEAETYAVTLNIPVEERGDYADIYDTAVDTFQPH